MRVLGIDPGTSRWAFVFLDDGEISKETSIPSSEIKENPQLVLDIAKEADLVVAPSGYGTVLKKIADLTEHDFSEILLKRPEEKTILGLENVLRLFKENSLNAYILPGVKLLPTVPEEKKKDKIDMGTPDKLCVAVAAIVDQSRRLKLHYNETSFVLAEIGFGFDAFLSVKNGQIVNGIGGTLATSTWRGADGEILYLQGKLPKTLLRKGNLDIIKVRQGALKDVYRLYNDSKEILVSGSKADDVFDFLKQKHNNVVKLKTCESSNAAYGAAIIADGLAGGEFKELIDLLKIKEAKGSNLDYTTI